VSSGAALFSTNPEAGWPVLWRAISSDKGLGRKLIEAALNTLDGIAFSKLSAVHLGEMYLWLEQEYPESERPNHRDGKAPTVTAREQVYRLKNTILNRLEKLGTQDACNALQRVMEALPELDWLPFVVSRAERELRRQTWTPPSPHELSTLFQDPHKRLITTIQHLMGLVIESLDRLQAKLHGETPAVHDLWNNWTTQKKTRWKPKGEQHLSDYIKRHLDHDLKDRGVIVNREVEIRRKTTSAGEETDIHVDAVDDAQRLTVIIEVKGCWHTKTKTALQEQLVDRYLQTNLSAGGLYVVGCYCCDAWDTNDYRCGDARRNGTMDDLQIELESQAALAGSTEFVRSLVLDCSLH
jgi:hypothetical protein